MGHAAGVTAANLSSGVLGLADHDSFRNDKHIACEPVNKRRDYA